MEFNIATEENEIQKEINKLNALINDFYDYLSLTDIEEMQQIETIRLDIVQQIIENPFFYYSIKRACTPENLMLIYFQLTGKFYVTSNMQNHLNDLLNDSNGKYEIMAKWTSFKHELINNINLSEDYEKMFWANYEDCNIFFTFVKQDKKYMLMLCFAIECFTYDYINFYQYYANGAFSVYDSRCNAIFFLKEEFSKQSTITYEDMGISNKQNGFVNLVNFNHGIHLEEYTRHGLNELLCKLEMTSDNKSKIYSCLDKLTKSICLAKAPSFFKFEGKYLPKYISSDESPENLIILFNEFKNMIDLLEKDIKSEENSKLFVYLKMVLGQYETFITQYLEIYLTKIRVQNFINNILKSLVKEIDKEDDLWENLVYVPLNSLMFISNFYQVLNEQEKQNYIKFIKTVIEFCCEQFDEKTKNYFNFFQRESYAPVFSYIIENDDFVKLCLNDMLLFEELCNDKEKFFIVLQYISFFPNSNFDKNEIDKYRIVDLCIHNLMLKQISPNQINKFIYENPVKFNLCINLCKLFFDKNQEHILLYKNIFNLILDAYDYLSVDNVNFLQKCENNLISRNKLNYCSKKLQAMNILLAKKEITIQSKEKNEFLSTYFNFVIASLFYASESEINYFDQLIDVIIDIIKNEKEEFTLINTINLFSQINHETILLLAKHPEDSKIANIFSNIIDNSRLLEITNTFFILNGNINVNQCKDDDKLYIIFLAQLKSMYINELQQKNSTSQERIKIIETIKE
jgi:hypothetical protein